jgi:hypothetical protein
MLCLFFAFRLRARQRLLRMLPTVKSQGVFIGFVELKGTADSRRPLTGWLSDQECVHYTWSVEEHWSHTYTETYKDSDGKTRTRTVHESGWKTVADGGEMIRFYLRDETGVLRVDPKGAQIEPAVTFEYECEDDDPLYYEKGPEDAVRHSDYRRRFVEHGIPLGLKLYVVGQSREREDIVAPEIAWDEKAPMFLITCRTEKDIASGMSWSSWGLAFLAFVLLGVGVGLGCAGPEGFPVVSLIVAGAGFLAGWLLGWIWMVYNSLVEIRHRVRRAGSLVDIELKRRHDLIPNLVAAVQGFSDFESTVQKEVAVLRSQMEATLPGQPGPDPAAVLPSLRAIAERYPDLKANDSFLELQESLIETEQRIALARGYFNEIATGYNTCLEVVPDRFVASLGALRPQPLLAAADFERAAVTVDLD